MDVIEKQAEDLFQQGSYTEALQVFKQLRDFQMKNFSKEDGRLVHTRTMIGKCLYRCGKLEEATKEFQENLSNFIHQGLLTSDPIVLEVENELALCIMGLGDYKMALEIFSKIAEEDEKIKSPEDKELLVTRNNIALCLNKLGKYQEALEIYKDVHVKQQKALGVNHPHTLMTQVNIGALMIRLGKPEDALQLFRVVETELKKQFGADHPDLMQVQNNISVCLQELGRNDEAMKLKFEVQSALEKQFGKNHPSLFVTKNNIIDGLVKKEEYDEAIIVALETRRLQEEQYGPKHPELLTTLINLATCYSKKKNYEEALQIEMQAEKTFGGEPSAANHAGLITLRNNMAVTLQKLGRIDEALALSSKSVEDMQKVFGADHPSVFVVKSNNAVLLKELKRYKEGAEILRDVERYQFFNCPTNLLDTRKELLTCYVSMEDLNQALEVFSHVVGKGYDDHDLTKKKNALALALLDKGRIPEALRVFKEVETVMETLLPPTNGALLNTKNNIAVALVALGKEEEAEKIYEYIDKMRMP